MVIISRRSYEEEKKLKEKEHNRRKGKIEPYVKMQIGPIERETLIDTGAQISAMTKAFYDKLNEMKISMTVISIKKFMPRGAFLDKEVPVLYKVMIKFNINGKKFSHGIYLVETLTNDLILGFDFMKENNARIVQEGNEFRLIIREKDKGTKVNSIEIIDPEHELNLIKERRKEVFKLEIGHVVHYKHEIKMINKKAYKSKTPGARYTQGQNKKTFIGIRTTGGNKKIGYPIYKPVNRSS